MESKQAKTPSISDKTKILCFDLESNGLHGEVFAVGAVLMNAKGKVLDEFTGRTKIIGQVDAWVEKHVLPAIEAMPITHKSYKALREAFWRWYLKAEPASDYVLVSNGYPVEYRFLLKCQEENLAERYWRHPFPIIDLTSLLLLTDADPSGQSIQKVVKSQHDYLRHNPLDDARVTALAAFAAFRQAGKIS